MIHPKTRISREKLKSKHLCTGITPTPSPLRYLDGKGVLSPFVSYALVLSWRYNASKNKMGMEYLYSNLELIEERGLWD